MLFHKSFYIVRFDIDAREKKQKGDTFSKVEPYLKRIRDAFNEGKNLTFSLLFFFNGG